MSRLNIDSRCCTTSGLREHVREGRHRAGTLLAVARDYAAPIGEFPAHLIRFRREARRHRPAPPKRGLVLEVGSGATPHPRTDVVVDKYVVDAFERDGAWMDLSRPLVVADGQRLPFADRSFAYTLALHLLEHATDPIAFAG